MKRMLNLEHAYNVRDIGGYQIGSNATVRWRSFVRASSFSELSAKDVATLGQLGIRTVVDLRSKQEIRQSRYPISRANDIDYHNIGVSPTLRYRITNVQQMLDHYLRLTRNSLPQLRDIFQLLGEADTYPVVVHCTQGKDRTGIVTALVLAVLGVSPRTIIEDYTLSAKCITDHVFRNFSDYLGIEQNRGLHSVREKARARHLFRHYYRNRHCPPSVIRRFLARLESDYGTIETYLHSIGVTSKCTTNVKANLIRFRR